MQSIILHVGAGKTGTSAIQTALARVRDELPPKGIYYPYHPSIKYAARGKASSGNADILATYVVKKQDSEVQADARLKRWLSNILSESAGKEVLLSSEALCNGKYEQFAKVKKLFDAANVRPRIIYYVRHLADSAISGHGQWVKTGLITHNLERALVRFRAPFREHLEMFAAIFGREAIEVRLYDDEKDDLFNNFIKHLGIHDLHVTVERVNRSFTRTELEFMRRLAGMRIPAATLKQIGDTILYELGDDREPFVITQTELDLMAARNQDVIDYVNNVFFDKNPRLRLKSNELRVGSRDACELQSRDSCFIKIIETIVHDLSPDEDHRMSPSSGTPDARMRQLPIRGSAGGGENLFGTNKWIDRLCEQNPALFENAREERRASKVLTRAFAMIGNDIDEVEDGIVGVNGLGQFRVRTITKKDNEGNEKTRRVISLIRKNKTGDRSPA